MKRDWLRGLLLGASMVLLLGGGVALAQGTLSVDKTCVECVPAGYWNGQVDHQLPADRYVMTITGEGWAASSQCGDLIPAQMGDVYHELRWSNGDVWTACAERDPDGSFVWGPLWWGCEICQEDVLPGAYEAGVSQDEEECSAALGEMEYYFEDDTGGRSISVLLAEDCTPEEEFVPEPGTLMLMSSGLAGLAGYAGLRWRTRR